MKFQKFKSYQILKFIFNKYVLILIFFVIWMLFFDENSYLLHRRLDNEIDELKSSIIFYQSEIEKNNKTIKELRDSLQLERFAREQYLMKKENEDIYIIEFDTVN